jgi:hypothetical protein
MNGGRVGRGERRPVSPLCLAAGLTGSTRFVLREVVPCHQEEPLLLQADDELLAQLPQMAVQGVPLGEVELPALA